MLLDKQVISQINMSGRGGGESAFAPALLNFRRVSECLYDFVNDKTTERVELKKQRNLQWFDGWKYYNLSDEDRKIIMMFVLHDGNKITKVYSISLGTMIDTLLADSEYTNSGWSVDVLKELYSLKQVAPKVQSKLPLKVKDFIQKHQHLFYEQYTT